MCERHCADRQGLRSVVPCRARPAFAGRHARRCRRALDRRAADFSWILARRPPDRGPHRGGFRQLPSGEYGYVGRMDTQIKINGYRVELGEIEAVLRQSGCSEAVALPWPDRNKTKAIIAFVTPDRPIREISAFARSRLPTYMVPRRIEPVDVFPLNVNGKTDRGALGQLATAWRFRA